MKDASRLETVALLISIISVVFALWFVLAG